MAQDLLVWLGILFCISQSAMFSGLNLAVFSVSRLRIETAADQGDARAARVLALRRNSNFTLTTILWGNVGINVLLTLLADSMLAGVTAFLFSTFLITIFGEILPQAWFSRHALQVAAWFAPVLRVYQVLLAPVAWPSARLLDAWIGSEGIPWFREHELRQLLYRHAKDGDTEISRIEALGASNFLALDDIPVGDEGEPVDPRSIIRLPFRHGRPVLPAVTARVDDPFLLQLTASGRKWIVIVDEQGMPQEVLSVPTMLRQTFFGDHARGTDKLCHRPLIVYDPDTPLGQLIGRFRVHPERPGDDVIDEDVILVWSDNSRRIITGTDLLGRLLRRIVRTPD